MLLEIREAIMKILVLGAGVIGTTYAWQFSNAGHDVSILVRKSKHEQIEKEGIHIRYTDERQKKSDPMEVTYHPVVVDKFHAQDNYDLIIVSVRAHQLEELLPSLADGSGKADILFFGNNWWGEEKIRRFLPAEKYLFGFSRLVGGWRAEDRNRVYLLRQPGAGYDAGRKRWTAHTTTAKPAGCVQESQSETCYQPGYSWLVIHPLRGVFGSVGGIMKSRILRRLR